MALVLLEKAKEMKILTLGLNLAQSTLGPTTKPNGSPIKDNRFDNAAVLTSRSSKIPFQGARKNSAGLVLGDLIDVPVSSSQTHKQKESAQKLSTKELASELAQTQLKKSSVQRRSIKAEVKPKPKNKNSKGHWGAKIRYNFNCALCEAVGEP